MRRNNGTTIQETVACPRISRRRKKQNKINQKSVLEVLVSLLACLLANGGRSTRKDGRSKKWD
jgi:hypothetical protein